VLHLRAVSHHRQLLAAVPIKLGTPPRIFVLVILLLVDLHDRRIGHLKGMWLHHFFISMVSGTLESFDAYSELSSVPLLHVAMVSTARRRRSHCSMSPPTKMLYSLSHQCAVNLTDTHEYLLFSYTAHEVTGELS
jgi:hypothetical protein